jgi:hypothetical protein
MKKELQVDMVCFNGLSSSVLGSENAVAGLCAENWTWNFLNIMM